MESITVSYLVTKEDYTAYKMACAKADLKKNDRTFIYFAGVVLILIAAAGCIFLGRGAYASLIYGLIGALGIFMALFPDFIYPNFIKYSAIKFYDTHGEKMIAANVEFTAESIKINTDRYMADIPYSFLFRVYDDKNVIVFYIGKNETRFIPKRVSDECEEICRRVRAKIV